MQPDTRPGIKFDEDEMCPACRFAEQESSIDWEARKQELEKIVEYGSKNNISGYECIIGVSGGKDSVRQAMFAKEELGLNPLLVCCTSSPEQITDLGTENMSNLIELGFDVVTYSPAPETWKRLIRQSFLREGNLLKSTEMALYASAPKMAIAYQIPLVFLGENPAITVGCLDVGSTNGDASRMKNSNTIRSGPDILLEDGIGEKNIIMYRYPSDDEMELAKLKIVYLGYYIRGFAKRTNADFSIKNGMKVRHDPPEDLGDITGHEALDDDFQIINQMLKYLKLGFGKTTDQVCEEIRLGKMTRSEAIEMVSLYDGNCADRYIKRFCNYIGISEEQFWEVANSFRNTEIWETDNRGIWKHKYPVESLINE